MSDYMKIKRGFFSDRKLIIVIDVPWFAVETKISKTGVANKLRRRVGRIARNIMEDIFQPIYDGIIEGEKAASESVRQ